MSGIWLSPSSIRNLYEPSQCELRTWLAAQGIEGLPPSDFEELLFEKGHVHEENVLKELKASFTGVTNLGGRDNDDCEQHTRAAIEARDGSLLYQAGLRTQAVIDGVEVTISGYPDFLMPVADSWVIGDAKLTSTTLNPPRKKDGYQTQKKAKEHIHLQLQLYSWMLRELFGIEASELRIYTGRLGTVELVEDDGGQKALDTLAHIIRLQGLSSEPFEAVGWSKCKVSACAYRDRCWPRAIETKALGVIPELVVSQVEHLKEEGVLAYDQLLADYDEFSLAELAKKRGSEDPKKVAWARKVLESAAAMESGEHVHRRGDDGEPIPLPPELSADPNYVMFDLEGDQAEAGLPVDIYLWGMQVYGEEPGEYVCAIAPFEEGDNGIEKGWWEFLQLARKILDEHPGIRFVHWAVYEKTWVGKYMSERFGDDEYGTAAEVLDSLIDLAPIAEEIVAFPTPSNSLKVVEAFVGFERKEEEVSKGDESMVAYAAAKASGDPEFQAETLASIAAYNKEDLEGTWVVHRWMVENLGDADRDGPKQSPSEFMKKNFDKSPKANEKLA